VEFIVFNITDSVEAAKVAPQMLKTFGKFPLKKNFATKYG